MLTLLLEQYHAYLHLQHRIAKAIYNQDEGLLIDLKQASQELFVQIECQRIGAVEAVDIQSPPDLSVNADLPQLIQVMKEAQQQVRENENALQFWLDQMKSDVQHHRRSHATHGVLATYVQQRQGLSSLASNLDNSVLSPESGFEDPVPPPPVSPWVIPGKALDTTGHQVNHQS